MSHPGAKLPLMSTSAWATLIISSGSAATVLGALRLKTAASVAAAIALLGMWGAVRYRPSVINEVVERKKAEMLEPVQPLIDKMTTTTTIPK